MIHFSILKSGTPKRSRPPARLVALVDGDLVAALVQLLRPRRGRPARSRRRRRSCRCARPAARARPSPRSKARSMIASSICLIVTGSSLMPSTQAASHGAGQSGPVNSGKLLVACRWSIASLQSVAVDEVVPVGDQVAERAAVVAERARRSPCSARPGRAARRSGSVCVELAVVAARARPARARGVGARAYFEESAERRPCVASADRSRSCGPWPPSARVCGERALVVGAA